MKTETNKCRSCPHNKLLEATNWHYCDGNKCEVEIRADERAKVLDEVSSELNKYHRDINLANCPFGFIDLALDNVRRR